MTMDVALGLAPVLPRGGERGAKAEKHEADGFAAALAGKSAKAAPHRRDAGADEDPRSWKLAAACDDRLALRMPLAPDADADPGDAIAAALIPAAPGDDDAAAAAAIAAAPAQFPSPRQSDARASLAEGGGEADQGKTGTGRMDDGAALRTLLQAASGDAERQMADDGERSAAQQQPRQQERPAVAREGRVASQTPATASAPGEAGPRSESAPERPRLVGAAAMSPRVDADSAPGRMQVNVLGFSTSSAPVMPPAALAANIAPQLSTTAMGVVAAIEAEPTWRAAAEAPPGQRAQPQTHGTVSSLRIQLNPAELGMVTARLVASGSQLEIEIRVESNDARQRLANDADAIVKALRGVGYDVEKVTIQQAPQGGNGAPNQGAAGRGDAFAQQDQQPRDKAGANAGERNGREEADNGRTVLRHAGETAAQRAGGGVYI